jgi:hypothetical protein
MYTTCIYCQQSLGRNQCIEEFPTGRRLAFDAAKGRLWVICVHCTRWNLSAIEERWEAIESCERAFRGTRLRLATPNIGLARVAEGLDLVRVGRPLKPEMAAWRYGREFLRRRRTRLALAAGGAVLSASALVGIPAVLVGAPLAALVSVAPALVDRLRSQKGVAALVPQGRSVAVIRGEHAMRARILRGLENGANWSLFVEHDRGDLRVHGNEALRLAGIALARVNRRGAGSREVQDAVQLLAGVDSPDALFERVGRFASPVGDVRGKEFEILGVVTGSLFFLPIANRIALEMAAHEESERRALEGELAELERAWREAEEIATIADSLLLPHGVEQWLRRKTTDG